MGVGHGVERPLEADVVIRMDLVLAPLRGIEALGFEGEESLPLDVLEDGQRPLPGGPVGPDPRDLEAPAAGLSLDVLPIDPLLAAEEALSDVRNAPLDVGLAGGIGRPGCIDHEAPVASVLFEGPLEDGVVAIRLRDGCLQVVDDDAPGDASEEEPGLLQAVDHVPELLGVGDLHVLVAAVDQDHHQGPGHTPVTRSGVRDQTQPSEVYLGQLAGLALGHPDRDTRLTTEAAVLDREPM
jgi:hypothetical protein